MDSKKSGAPAITTPILRTSILVILYSLGLLITHAISESRTTNKTDSVSINSSYIQVDSLARAEEYNASLEKKAQEQVAKQKTEDAARDKQNQLAQSAPQPTGTSSYSSQPHRDPRRIDVLVNKKHPLIPLRYAPSLTSVNCAGHGSISVQVQAKDDLAALCSAAAQAGVPIAASSSYRSYSTQISTYNYWVSVDGQAAADVSSARAGYSEHQTGFAIDFRVPGGASLEAFTGTAQQQWLAVHGPSFGFIQRYTTAGSSTTGYIAESWHYRYIGRAAAQAYSTSGATSLEDFWGMPGGGY